MAKEYKTLLGNRVYIEMDMPTYTIVMDKAIRKKLVAETAEKLNVVKETFIKIKLLKFLSIIKCQKQN